jgi:formate hydrogenlyase subunit 3/multisubunit Na+/H+ antiporter MnhD subunit
MGKLLLMLVVGLPIAMAAASFALGDRWPERLPRLSNFAALALAVIVSLALVDVELALPGGRALVLSPVAQLGVQLLALAMLGFSMSVADEAAELANRWLAVAWLSLSGLVLALLVTSITLAVLTFVAAALIWALAPPGVDKSAASGPGLRYAALLALAVPPLVTALRLAEIHTAATPELEPLVLALIVPGFGLILSVVPLHAWTVTLASGSPRAMVIGVLGLVQTAGFILLLRTLERYPWLIAGGRGALIAGGALSLVIGGWLALASRRDDPDDWLAYAVVANTGLLLMGLATQSQSAATGVTLMLFARVLALVTVALASRAAWRLAQAARVAGTLTLAGTPGLAGFPGLWLIVAALQLDSPGWATIAVLAGSGLLLATALRRWWLPEPLTDAVTPGTPRRRWPVVVLIVVLILLGIVPQIVAGAFGNALRGPFLLHQ